MPLSPSITIAVKVYLFSSFAFERFIKRPSPPSIPSELCSDSLWHKSTGTALHCDSGVFDPEIQLIFGKNCLYFCIFFASCVTFGPSTLQCDSAGFDTETQHFLVKIVFALADFTEVPSSWDTL